MTFAPIRLLITGGTFDKQYDEITGTLAFRETNVAEVLARGRCRLPLEVEVEVLMLKDSLDLSDADRARIVAAARDCAESRVVITHGTEFRWSRRRARSARRASRSRLSSPAR